jgi:hypothetical protein
MALATIAALAATLTMPPLADVDADGIPDEWETAGHGPINPSAHGCSPRKQDLFVVVCIRPGMTRAQVEPTLARAKAFFAALPGRNPDGTAGINMITVWGNTLAESDRSTPYPEVYERGMPTAWRGIGHGILLDPGTGGGGQTNRADWSGISNNWHTIVHELGHQLGLGHEPPGSRGQSPLYTSLMNYDYNYQFNGDANLVHFSSGKFAAVRLNETALSEVLSFPIADLQFLSNQPYNFKIASAGPRTTHVDWNRNGVLGEARVQADIDDGYAVALRGEHRLGKTAGPPSLVVAGRSLIAVYPDLTRQEDYAGWQEAGLSPSRTGLIVARAWDGRAWSPKAILARAVGGDPHAVYAHGKLYLALPVPGSYMVQQHAAASPFRREAMMAGLDDVKRGETRHPLLVSVGPNQLWLFVWSETTKRIVYRKVNVETGATPRVRFGPVLELRTGATPTSPHVTSQIPIHAVYDHDIERIILVTGERENTTDGRMKLHTLGRVAPDGWFSLHSRWTMGAGGFSRTRARPWIVFDPSRNRGPRGGYLVYHKGDVIPANEKSATWVSRTIGDATSWGGWRTNLVGNEWVTTRSAVAGAAFGGDIAHAVRWFGGDLDHELLVNLRASGIQDGIVADHDDVTFIRTTGLRRSLGR